MSEDQRDLLNEIETVLGQLLDAPDDEELVAELKVLVDEL